MSDNSAAATQVTPLLVSLIGEGWVVGLSGVIPRADGSVKFFVQRGSADALRVAIETYGLAMPYTVEETDWRGVIYPPL